MDKYVSTYIGRPLAVFERDYDTRWPDYGQEAEGVEGGGEVWVDVLREEKGEKGGEYEALPGRVLECFSAASKLCAYLSFCSVLDANSVACSCDPFAYRRSALFDSAEQLACV